MLWECMGTGVPHGLQIRWWAIIVRGEFDSHTLPQV